MKTFSNTQEILLMTNCTFSNKDWCEINSPEGKRRAHPAEQLEEACWNGLIIELLPEIMQNAMGSENIFLWDVETRKSYLKMSLGVSFPVFEYEHSIDPHIFLDSLEMN